MLSLGLACSGYLELLDWPIVASLTECTLPAALGPMFHGSCLVLVSEAIVAEGLAKRYPNGIWEAVDASFTVERSSVAVLVGPNGAGKTTTVGMLSTILKPSRSRGLVLGLDIVTDARRLRGMIALMPQEARVDLNWTPMEAVKWYLVARGWSLGDASARARRFSSPCACGVRGA